MSEVCRVFNAFHSDLPIRGGVSDRPGAAPDADRARRRPLAQDLPPPVRQLLRLHLLHRLRQGELRRLPGGVQQALR